jgi:hypothetical protein
MVRVDPGVEALGLGQHEAVRDEAAPVEVELAHDVRVDALAGERDERPPAAAREHLCPVPVPALALRPGERVEVEEHLPLRLGLAVLVERRATPDAARVAHIPPEVVEAVALLRDSENPRIGLEDPDQLGLELRELRRPRELLRGLGVALLHPGERLLARDVFQPEVLVVGLRGPRGGHPSLGVHSRGEAQTQGEDDPGALHGFLPATRASLDSRWPCH